MALPNPFTRPPRLPSPSKRASRSVSHSPVRRAHLDYDPLLRDLSPSSTLRAFLADPQDIESSNPGDLIQRLQTSPQLERALGTKAAQACLDIRSWAREIERWEWPGTFESPGPVRKETRISQMSSDTLAMVGSGKDADYWGSLPSRTVQDHERRLGEIERGLKEIDVNGLKEYVLFSHHTNHPEPAAEEEVPIHSNGTATLKPLGDSTALITATILQTLPYLARLSRAIQSWAIRLSILRNAQDYLSQLRQARADLDHGWAAMAVSQGSSDPLGPKFSPDTVQKMRDMMERQVQQLGRTLDRFLDELEGSADTVPDFWISEFEQLESAYGYWVVQAERRVLESEWHEDRELTSANEPRSEPPTDPMPSDRRDDGNRQISAHQNAISAPIAEQATEPVAEVQNTGDIQSVESRGRMISTENRRPRHIPIILDYDGDGQNYPVGDNSSGKPTASTASTAPESTVAQTRAIFLSNAIEKTQSLKESKSPVRHFEHATNSFTRLFKRGHSPEQTRVGRSRSNSSKFSLGSRKEKKTIGHSPKPSAGTSAVGIQPESQPHLADRDIPTPPLTSSYPKPDSPVYEQDHPAVKDENDPPFGLSKGGQGVPSASIPKPEVYQPTGLSSPFRSSNEGQFSDDWPLSSRSTTPQVQDARAHVDDLNRDSESSLEFEAPKASFRGSTFDQASAENFQNDATPRPAPARGADTREILPEAGTRAAADAHNRRGATSPRSMRNTNTMAHIDEEFVPAAPRGTNPSDSTYRDNRKYIIDPDLTDGRNTLGNTELAHEEENGESNDSENLPRQDKPERVEEADESHHVESDSEWLSRVNRNSHVHEQERPAALTKRNSTASIISIEGFQRALLVDVPKRMSSPSLVSPIDTPAISRQASVSSVYGDRDKRAVSPVGYENVGRLNSPRRQASTSSSPGPNRTGSLLRKSLDLMTSVPLAEASTESSPTDTKGGPPLNAIVSKLRHPDPQDESVSSSSDSAWEPSAPIDSGDVFDRHVHEVLESLPAQIRFRARPGAETPQPRAHVGARAKAPRVPSRSGGLTLAPAHASPTKTRASEVKEYHLTSPGSDEPIKLFVRLVGESARCMVRVGGGWEDLSEYLKQYAEHHASRTLSEGNVDAQPAHQSARVRAVSGSTDPKGPAPTPSAPVPSVQVPSAPMASSAVRNGARDNSNPRRRVWIIDDSLEADAAPQRTATDTTPRTPTQASTTQATAADRVTQSPTRPDGSDLGMAGSSSDKQSNLSEQKAKWVEGMLERAKTASAEKSKEDRYFSEIGGGKPGSTKRLIFRSTSGTGNGA